MIERYIVLLVGPHAHILQPFGRRSELAIGSGKVWRMHRCMIRFD
jgi:hypothetical protein